MEVWKDIQGYEGMYQVSSEGRVKSLNYNRTGTERVLRPARNNNGYLYVTLCKDGKMKKFKVHRLVATAFIPNPHNLPQVNHKDERVDNNRAENLEFCTAEYNNNYGTRNERMLKNRTGNRACKPILQFTRTGIFVTEYPSTMEAERVTGIHQSGISKCALGDKNYSHAGGYIWKYKIEAA